MKRDRKENTLKDGNSINYLSWVDEVKCDEVKGGHKSIIVNDLLSFAYNKMNNMPKNKLITCLKEFYAVSDAFEAYQLLIDYLPDGANIINYKKIAATDPYLGALKVLKYLCIKNRQPLIVCKNLDNIPKISHSKNLFYKKRVKFIEEHEAIKSQIKELYECLQQAKELLFLVCTKTTEASNNIPEESNSLNISYPLPDPPRNLQCPSNQSFEVEEKEIILKEQGIEIYEDKYLDYLVIEQVFDENGGWMTLYKCQVCRFSSSNEDSVVQHNCLQNNHTDSEVANKCKRIHMCYSCMKTFKSKSSLRFHNESRHQNEKRRYQCPLCTETFMEESWKDHVRLCSGNGITMLTQDDIHCKLCDIFYSDEKLLKNHKAFHDQSRPFECHECKFRFYSQKSVEYHFKVHAIERLETPYSCPFCSRKFIYNNKLEEHTRTHTGERPYKCTLCNFSCIRPSGLKAHIRIHTANKDFECDICGRKFKLKTKLTVHRKVHSSNRPFKCPDCGKGFKTGREMTSHHRNHLGIRNYPCSYCNYKAVNASVLRGHINVHFNKKPFKCSQCNFGCNHKSYLNWHIKNSHPNIIITKL